MDGTSVESTAGIILVGTYPSNITTFDRLLPRPLLPVAHKPLFSYAVSWLRQAGIRDVAICSNHWTQALQAHLARHAPDGDELSYYEEAMPRGAAGSVRDAAWRSDAENFVVTDGTAVPTVELGELLASHRASGAAATVVVHAERPRRGQRSFLVPCGIYVFARRALDLVAPRGFCDIKEKLIPRLYQAGEKVSVHAATGATARVLDAGTYLAVNEWMVEQLVEAAEPDDGYVGSGSVLAHRSAQISAGAVFVGPVLVGPGARVMAGATVVGPTSIGLEATVGRGALVSRTAVWRRSVVGDEAVADRCIVADDAVVEPCTRAFGVVKTRARQPHPEPMAGGRAGFADLFPSVPVKKPAIS